MGQEFCPRCGTPRIGSFRYCRECALDFDTLPSGTDLRSGPERVPHPATLDSPRAQPMPIVEAVAPVRGDDAGATSPRLHKPRRRNAAIATIVVLLAAVAIWSPPQPPSPSAQSTATPNSTRTTTPRPSSPTRSPDAAPIGETEEARVTRVIDGDTIEVDLDGELVRVRYIGIDTPELQDGASSQQLAVAASQANADLVEGQVVTLEKDTSEVDAFGRLLRYVWLSDAGTWRLVNLILVERGFARAIEYPPDLAWSRLLANGEAVAQASAAGLWAPSPTPAPTPAPTPSPTPIAVTNDAFVEIDNGLRAAFRGGRGTYTWTQVAFYAARITVRWNVPAGPACTVGWAVHPSDEAPIHSTIRVPNGRRVTGNRRYAAPFFDGAVTAVSSCPAFLITMEGYTPPPPKPGGGGGNCDPSYPDVCIPPYPPDLDCGDIAFRDFRVRGSDPHGFDGDNDGIGCES